MAASIGPLKPKDTFQLLLQLPGWDGSSTCIFALGDGTALPLSINATTLYINGAAVGSGNALTTNPLSQFAATTSLQLKGVISDETGSGALVFSTSPSLVTPLLGTPASGVLTNCTGYTTTNLSGTISNAQLAGSIVSSKLVGTDIVTVGTLTSGQTGAGFTIAFSTSTLTGTVPAANLGSGTSITTKYLRGDNTWQTIGGGGDALVANPLSQFAATTSSQLAGVISDETGSGALVFATSPVLVTPALGTPSAGVLTNCTGIASGLTAGNVTTNANLTGDITSSGNTTTLTNAPVISKVLTGYTSGAGIVASTDSILQAIQKLNGNDATNANLTGPITSSGNATSVASQTGTGTTFVMNTSPTLVTPLLGTPTSGTLTSCTGLPVSTGISGLASGIATFLATPSSANLASAVTDETGSGALVFASSPAFSGTPTAPTATGGTNTTQIATTAFVTAALSGGSGSTYQVLATVTNIATAGFAGSTPVTPSYTVPSGKTAVITALAIRCTAANSMTVGPQFRLGTSSNGNDIMADTIATGLTTSGKSFQILISGLSVSIAATGGVYYNWANGTGTSQTCSIDIIGYLV